MAKEETATPSKEDVGEKTFTQAEVDALVAPEVEKRKDAERASSRHGEKVKELETNQGDWQNQFQALRDEVSQNTQLQIMMSAEGKSPDDAEGLTSDQKGDYLKKAQALIAENTVKTNAERQRVKSQEVGERYRKRVEALGLTVKDKVYREIHRDVVDGNYEFADAQLEELEKAKTEEPKESEEDRQKAIDESARKMLEESGQLKTDTGKPSAGGLSGMSVESLKEKMGDPEWFAEHEAEITKLHAEGKFINK